MRWFFSDNSHSVCDPFPMLAWKFSPHVEVVGAPEFAENPLTVVNAKVNSDISKVTLVSVKWTLISVEWTLVSAKWTLISVKWTLVSVKWTLISVKWTLVSVKWTLIEEMIENEQKPIICGTRRRSNCVSVTNWQVITCNTYFCFLISPLFGGFSLNTNTFSVIMGCFCNTPGSNNIEVKNKKKSMVTSVHWGHSCYCFWCLPKYLQQ
jgi:hypothetical protein